jgi:hypothetical protein
VFSPIHNLEMVDEKSDCQQSAENEENEFFLGFSVRDKGILGS